MSGRCVSFFFFQAEDGIRDYRVTGVQTCALPILPAVQTATIRGLAVTSLARLSDLPQVPTVSESGFAGFEASGWNALFARSEERRVGKECRSRWSPYH